MIDENVNGFKDVVGNILRVNDIVVFGNIETTSLSVGRVAGFTNTMVRVYRIAQNRDNRKLSYANKKPQGLSIIYRNTELVDFPDEWLNAFWDKNSRLFDFGQMDETRAEDFKKHSNNETSE